MEPRLFDVIIIHYFMQKVKSWTDLHGGERLFLAQARFSLAFIRFSCSNQYQEVTKERLWQAA